MADIEGDKLFYEELRRLARAIKRNDSATISPTALVHEAWLKLAKSPQIGPMSPTHFKRIAVRAMRQVLVEAARHRIAEKRGGGAALVEFEEALGQSSTSAADVVALNDVLDELERLDARRAAGVTARYFGGFTNIEIAAMLNISEETVLADWRAAKAWLGHRLRKGSNYGPS